jgi:photosystem II reaction center protein PsbM
MNTLFVTNLVGYSSKSRLVLKQRVRAPLPSRSTMRVHRAVGCTRAAVLLKQQQQQQLRDAGATRAPEAQTGSPVASAVSLAAAMWALPSMGYAAEESGMTVQFGAYLAVFLGTLIPVAFLIILYIQSETRKAAMEAVSGSGSEEEEELEFE